MDRRKLFKGLAACALGAAARIYQPGVMHLVKHQGKPSEFPLIGASPFERADPGIIQTAYTSAAQTRLHGWTVYDDTFDTFCEVHRLYSDALKAKLDACLMGFTGKDRGEIT